MKFVLTVIIVLCGHLIALSQHEPSGTWQGNITPGLRLIFHFAQDAQHRWFGTLDSPDQGASGIELSNVTLKGDSLIVEINSAKAIYSARFGTDSTLAGIWKQGSASVPLEVKKQLNVPAPTIPARPQTPKPPFAYNSEEVEYDNADHSAHFGATLTYPKTGSRFPVAVMITGSGLQDRDETIFYHKPFAVIADYLSKNGFAVLRVDDRSIGKSTGDAIHATTSDYANDVLASIHYVQSRKEIDAKKIGVIGHSEGGLIAPIVYTRFNKLAFIISLAGTGVPGSDILVRQQTDPLRGKGLSDSAFNAHYSLVHSTLITIQHGGTQSDSAVLAEIAEVYKQWKMKTPAHIIDALHATDLDGATYARQTAPELQPWLKYFISTDPAIFWARVKCPVLALNGSKDVQVYADQNIAAIQKALVTSGNAHVTTKIFPGLNHLFQHCSSCTVEEYQQITETFAPEVLQTMLEWLQKNIAIGAGDVR